MLRLIACCLLFTTFCKKAGLHMAFGDQALDTSESTLSAGRNLGLKHCTQCHIFPEPNLLTQESYNYTLSYMGLLMGFDSSANLADPLEIKHFQNRFRLLQATGRIPSKPAISRGDFSLLRNYFLAKAGSETTPDTPVQPASGSISKFPFEDKVVTLVRRIPGTQNIAVGGGIKNSLQITDAQFSPILETSLSSPPVDVQYRENTYYVVTLGDLLGGLNSAKKAELWAVTKNSKVKMLGGLTRSTQILMHDMNGDRREDFAIASFGNQEDGELAWYDNQAGGMQKHLLAENASIVRAAIVSKPGVFPVKIVALHAGAREQLVLYTVHRDKPEVKVLENYPPTFGSVWLEAVDLDGDNREELLVLSGDNADCGPNNAIKPYQGLRIYSLKDDSVSLTDFYPIQGALSLNVKPRSEQNALQILVMAYYADVRAPRDLVVLTRETNGKFMEKSYFMNSRATVGIWLDKPNSVLVGSGNTPLRQRVGESTQVRQFNGPALQEITFR